MEREALKLTLEALLNSVDLVVEDAYNAEQLYGSYPTRQARIGGLKVLADKHREAITAAEAALAQPAQERQWIWLSDADIAEVVDTTCQYTGGYEEYLIKKAERKIRSMNNGT